MAAYQWKTGSYHGKVSAQKAGEICDELERRGELNAQNLVDVSRPAYAPLHEAFEWDDGIAAEEWRKQQARCIINSIVVVAEEKPPVRAYYNITARDANYYSLATVVQQPDKYQMLLRQAKSELQAIRRKYRQITELDAIFALIDNMQDAS